MSLADALHKPLIPLLLENLDWPPPGPLSPILTQLLYIDCTSDNMEETWAGPKFDELITKIDQHVPRPQAHGAEGESSSGKPEMVPPLADQAEVKSEQKLTETPQRIEKSEPEEEPTPVENAPSAPVASRPPEDADRNNSKSLSTQPPPASLRDDNDQLNNGSKNNGQKEQKPAVQTASSRDLSETDSLHSGLGHDGFNAAYLDTGAVYWMMGPRKSSCCTVL